MNPLEYVSCSAACMWQSEGEKATAIGWARGMGDRSRGAAGAACSSLVGAGGADDEKLSAVIEEGEQQEEWSEAESASATDMAASDMRQQISDGR